jgi:cob(I)alamin adenosyltransferase
MSDIGYVHVYTGNGKGKTTAALGLALRAAGAGLRVYIGQFVKGMRYSEIKAFERFKEQVTIQQFGRDCFVDHDLKEEDIAVARQGLDVVRDVITSGDWDVVVLDEANIAVLFGLFEVDDLLDLIDQKPIGQELVITGRYADRRLLLQADLVTEMKEVKHYYNQGVEARVGIER